MRKFVCRRCDFTRTEVSLGAGISILCPHCQIPLVSAGGVKTGQSDSTGSTANSETPWYLQVADEPAIPDSIGSRPSNDAQADDEPNEAANTWYLQVPTEPAKTTSPLPASPPIGRNTSTQLKNAATTSPSQQQGSPSQTSRKSVPKQKVNSRKKYIAVGGASIAVASLCIALTAITMNKRDVPRHVDSAPTDNNDPATEKRRKVEELVKVFRDGTPQEVAQAMKEIADYGGTATPLLIEMLGNENQRANWPKILQILPLLGVSADSAADAAIHCLNDDYMEAKIEAARFLRTIPSGKKALKDLWRNLVVNDEKLKLQDEIRGTIEKFSHYNANDRQQLRKLAGLPALNAKDPTGQGTTPTFENINIFVKAFYIELLSNMADLTPAEFTAEIEDLQIFKDNDSRMRSYMLKIIQGNPVKFLRRNQIKCLIPMLGDNSQKVRDNAREALENLTWDKTYGPEYVTRSNQPILDDKGQKVMLQYEDDKTKTTYKTGYTYAQEWELDTKYFTYSTQVSVFRDGKEVGKKTITHPSIKISKKRQIYKDDVDALIEILGEPTTPAEGQVYALDLILSRGSGAQIQLEKIAPLIVVNLPDDPKQEMSIEVVNRALCVVLSQKKPIDKIDTALLKLCKHPHEGVKGLALICLWLINDKSKEEQILRALYDALEDPNSSIREAAIKGLRYCMSTRDSRFVDELSLSIKALEESFQPDKRMMAARVLGNLGEKADTAKPALIKALSDNDINVRTRAVQALGKIGNVSSDTVAKIGNLLIYQLDQDSAKIRADKITLANSASRDLGFDHSHIDEQKQQLEAMYSLPSDIAERLLQNAELRRESLRALVSLKELAAPALPALEKFIGKTTSHEDLILAIIALKSIAKDSDAGCDQVVKVAIELFQNEAIQTVGDEFLAFEKLLEANNLKRSPLSNAVIDMFKEMGPKALRGICSYLETKQKRLHLTIDELQIIGSAQSIIAILSNEDVKTDQVIAAKLSIILKTHSREHISYLNKKSNWTGGPDDDKIRALLDRIIKRINEADKAVNNTITSKK